MNKNFESADDSVIAEKSKPRVGESAIPLYSRWWMAFLLELSDMVCLSLAVISAIAIRRAIPGGVVPIEDYFKMAPLLAVFIATYAWSGLYPGVGLSPVEELRKLSISTSGVFIILATISALTQSSVNYSRFIFVIAWILSLFFVQFGRWITRIVAIKLGVWGEPVAIVGFGSQSQKVIQYLQVNRRLGLKPYLAIDGFGTSQSTISTIPVFHISSSIPDKLPKKYSGIHTAVLVTSDVPEQLQKAIICEGSLGFHRLITISPLGWIGSMGIIPRDLEGFLGLEVRQNLTNVWEQAIKRIVDLILVLISSVIVGPLIGLITLFIRLDSRGPIFYRQERVGKGGGIFKIWKFRTMIPNADETLEDYFEQTPHLRTEWESMQKIKDDPRVTRIGRFLRKLSLDELPQVWNILKGEMSLVGPRPIKTDQIAQYGSSSLQLYIRVRPGLTGMWQVSGRNNLPFVERVRLDELYVRTWSIWLDIYILLRTVLVVLRRDGAF